MTYIRIDINSNERIQFEARGNRLYVIRQNITCGTNPMINSSELGISSWDKERINLDTNSDAFDCFQISEKVQCNNVIITTEYIWKRVNNNYLY